MRSPTLCRSFAKQWQTCRLLDQSTAATSTNIQQAIASLTWPCHTRNASKPHKLHKNIAFSKRGRAAQQRTPLAIAACHGLGWSSMSMLSSSRACARTASCSVSCSATFCASSSSRPRSLLHASAAATHTCSLCTMMCTVHMHCTLHHNALCTAHSTPAADDRNSSLERRASIAHRAQLACGWWDSRTRYQRAPAARERENRGQPPAPRLPAPRPPAPCPPAGSRSRTRPLPCSRRLQRRALRSSTNELASC